MPAPWSKIAALLLVFLSVGRAWADDDNTGDASDPVYGTSWGMTLALDGTGFYNDLIILAMEQIPSAKDYIPLPYKRAKASFAASGDACLYPTQINHLIAAKEITDTGAYLESLPFINVESHIFSQYGAPPLRALTDLQGKLLAHPAGSAAPAFVGQFGPRFLPTNDEMAKARMLISRRVDFMTGSLPDSLFVFRSLGHSLPPYAADLPLTKVGVGVVCHKTPANAVFIAALNQAILSVREAGAYRALFDRVGLDYRFLPDVTPQN